MRQVYSAQIKLTNRQLTVDFLKKILERKVGTHEVEALAQKVVKGEDRRNPEIVATLLRIKLNDAIMWAQRQKKRVLEEESRALYVHQQSRADQRDVLDCCEGRDRQQVEERKGQDEDEDGQAGEDLQGSQA